MTQGFQKIKEHDKDLGFFSKVKNKITSYCDKEKQWIVITNQGVGYIEKNDFYNEIIDEFCYFKNLIQLDL